MTTHAILTAAGSGSRLGFNLPKAFVPLRGLPLVVHAARRLAASGVVESITVTAPRAHLGQMRAVLAHWDVLADVVAGGPSRQASVGCGLAAVPASADVVLVHDAARPLAPAQLIARVARAVQEGHDGVFPSLPVTDTIKRVAPADGSGFERVTETVPRDELRIVQTPQGFRATILREVHDRSRALGLDEASAATDDAGMLEAAGFTVSAIPGDELALKITSAQDLAVAGLLLDRDSKRAGDRDEPTGRTAGGER